MALERATGLVLRFTDYSETSRIVTLYTRELGKVRALAKGGRRLKSNFESALDLLTVCSMVLFRKPGRGLDLVTEARVVERFGILTRQLEALYAGYYLAELLSEFAQEDDPHPLLFEAAVTTLRQLGDQSAVQELILRFETHLLRELGFAPVLQSCAACHQALPETGLALDPQVGGIVCPGCQSLSRFARAISSGAWQALRRLEGAATPERLETGLRTELRHLMNHTMSHLLGRRLRTTQYLTA
jgi:DNA repair protein RecO (recombination protein O)